ncbi:MAG: protein-disulfide isomerase [candidate division WWE3 bacterium CSP1-7]|uniref:Protein-disulfide isomerase n=1 Tax=candidate division WWE3 bacterium CSP1-7 TaxID=1576480 RepID=A0A0T5ZXX0_UNCKA|nr:MAG: protein-disulfide isomerase [candidate division WWE3 bacterium CSP1-7]
MIKKILIWAVLILGLAGATWGMAKLASAPSGKAATLANAVSDSDWIRGKRGAKVVLVEYSDFQCPACAFYAPIVNSIMEEFGDKIAFVYRHFPLPQHKQAELAARAAEAAGKQGKFWEMADLIFVNQKDWAEKSNARETLVSYAQLLNLDMNRFGTELDSAAVKKEIESDYLSGAAIIDYTPTFFLNGERIQNPQSYDAFRELIIQKLNQNP